ncbi:MAG: DUF4198 domain-containing protein [Thermoanaerobaculia bacterium]
MKPLTTPARAALALLALLTSASVARAHDFWLEPSTFTPAPGQRVAMRLRVGQGLQGDPVPRDPALLVRFVTVGPSGEAPVPGVPSTEPAGFTAFPAPGLYTVAYESRRAPVELDGPKFESYLKEEGLETIAALRARKGRSAAGAKEVFSRCAKSLIAAGGAAGPGFDRVLGQRLELVAEKDPYGFKGSGELPVRLLYEGKPLAGALIVAMRRGQPGAPAAAAAMAAKVAVRSDAKGRATLKLDKPGLWLIKAVHMIPAPPDSGADWESFWASLTFALPVG